MFQRSILETKNLASIKTIGVEEIPLVKVKTGK